MAFPKYDWPSVEDKLGIWPDSAIAQRLGCATVTVALHRTKRGIMSPAKLGPARQFQVRLEEDMYQRVKKINEARQAAGWAGNISAVIRDALALGLPQL